MPNAPLQIDYSFMTLVGEKKLLLVEMLRSARADMRPRDFAERHLVDEMVIAKWRALRTVSFEARVYDNHANRSTWSSTPSPTNPLHARIYQIARALSPDGDSVILAALSRLEARFHRQFCSALRLLLTLRRINPLPPRVKRSRKPSGENPAPRPSTSTSERKDPLPCNPSLSQA